MGIWGLVVAVLACFASVRPAPPTATNPHGARQERRVMAETARMELAQLREFVGGQLSEMSTRIATMRAELADGTYDWAAHARISCMVAEPTGFLRVSPAPACARMFPVITYAVVNGTVHYSIVDRPSDV